jgi:hypothetical protein
MDISQLFSSPWVSALTALLGVIVGALLKWVFDKEVQKQNAVANLEAERLRAESNLDVEKNKSAWNLETWQKLEEIKVVLTNLADQRNAYRQVFKLAMMAVESLPTSKVLNDYLHDDSTDELNHKLIKFEFDMSSDALRRYSTELNEWLLEHGMDLGNTEIYKDIKLFHGDLTRYQLRMLVLDQSRVDHNIELGASYIDKLDENAEHLRIIHERIVKSLQQAGQYPSRGTRASG